MAVTVAGCSSDGGGGGTSAPAPANTQGGGSSDAGGGASSGVAAAKAATEKAKQAPTSIPQTQKLKTKPETGKTFVFLKCQDVNQCAVEADGYKAATKAIGWNYKELSFKSSDPATLVSAMKQALDFKPVAVSFSGLPRAVYQSVIPEYRKAGVKMVTMYEGPTTYDDVLIGQVGGQKDVQEYGRIIGNWVVADSNGKANILLQEVNDFPILKDYVTGFKEAVEKNCGSGCKITELNNTIAQLGGQVVPAVVAALQKDRSINYVSTVNGPFLTGLPAALKAAGITNVKICGESGDTTNLTNVKNGTESAYTGLALNQASFAAMDMVLRDMQGLPFDKEGNGGSPKQLLTKDVDFKISTSYDVPSDYESQFKKLWLVG
ncbi:substrate-binding domain-containing protein [Jatrophihabitans fulvus]